MTPDQIAFHIGNFTLLITDKARAVSRQGELASKYARKLAGAQALHQADTSVYERLTQSRIKSFAFDLRQFADTLICLASEVDKMNGN